MRNKKSVLLLLLGITLVACNNPSQNITPSPTSSYGNNPNSNISASPSNVISETPRPQNSSIIENEEIKNIGKLKLVLKNNIEPNIGFNQNIRLDDQFHLNNTLLDDFGNLFFREFKLNIYSNEKKLERIQKNFSSLVGLDGKEVIKELKSITSDEIDWHSDYYDKDSKGNLYLLSRFELTKITPDRKANRYILGFDGFSSVTSDDESNIYVSSEMKSFIRKFSPDYKEFWTIDISSNTGSEKCYKPINLRADKKGNILFFDLQDQKVKQVSKDGKNISTIIGGGTKDFSENILGSEYKISSQFSKIIFDNNDNLYILERDKNHILKYNTETKSLTRFAGNGNKGFKGDNNIASEANLILPVAISFDKNNNAYIIDSGNNVIRKVDNLTQKISTFWGKDITRGDGNDLNNVFFEEINTIYPKNNNLYISEKDRIRKFDGNNIKTIAGNGYAPIVIPSAAPPINQTSDNADETDMFGPQIKYIDSNENIYISENSFYRIISPDNKIKKLNINANSISGDKNNNIYLSDWNSVRKIAGNSNEIIAGKERENSYMPPNEYTIKDGMDAKSTELNLSDIQIDSKNNIYGISDYRYNYAIEYGKEYPNKVLVKITPDKKLHILAGNTSKLEQDFKLENIYSSKDPFSIPIHPLSLFIDKNDNLYLIDQLYSYKKNPDNEMFGGYENSIIVRKFDKNMNMSIYAGDINKSESYINTDINENSINKRSNELVLDSSNFRGSKIDENGNIYFIGSDNSIYKIEYN